MYKRQANISRKGINADSVKNVIIDGNDIDGTAEQGIFATNLKGTTKLIQNNNVDTTGGDAIAVTGSDFVQSKSNLIGTAGGNITGNGISVIDSESTLVGWNTVKNASGDGINLSGTSDLSEIKRNVINSIAGNGVAISDAYKVKVNTNKIGLLDGANNIGGNGITASGTTLPIIELNEISNVSADGIKVSASDNAKISRNII